jgi:hypothetical protein
MVTLDEERLARLANAAADTFAQLGPDQKNALDAPLAADSGFAWSGRAPVVPASPLTIDRDAHAARPEASQGAEEAAESRVFGPEDVSLPPAPPRTELGRELWAIRRGIVQSGVPLLDWSQIEAEIAARRGERA